MSKEPDYGWIFPSGPYVKSVTGRLSSSGCPYQRRFRIGFDSDPGRWHNRLGDYVPEEYELVFILRGRGEYRNAALGIDVEVDSGTVLQRFPGQASCLRYLPGDQRVITCYMAVPGCFFESLRLCSALASSEPLLSFVPPPPLVYRLQKIFRALNGSMPLTLPVVTAQMYDWLVSAHYRMRRHVGVDSELYERACLLLAGYLGERIVLPEIAAELGISYRSFRRLFETMTGSGPGRYVIRMRLEKACDLLVSGMNIREVADRLNYPDVYTFSKQFRQFMKITPGQYRAWGGFPGDGT